MKLCHSLAPRLAMSLCALAGVACASAGYAQTVAQEPAPVYQDRLIGGGSLTADISHGDDSTSDTSGLAHSLQLDGVVSVLNSHGSGSDSKVSENGFIGKAQWETASYGAWSLDAAARTG